MMGSSKKNNKALANLNDEISDIISDRVILASYLLPPLYEIANPEHTSQFRLEQDPILNQVSDPLINQLIPVTSYGDLLSFRDTEKEV